MIDCDKPRMSPTQTNPPTKLAFRAPNSTPFRSRCTTQLTWLAVRRRSVQPPSCAPQIRIGAETRASAATRMHHSHNSCAQVSVIDDIRRGERNIGGKLRSRCPRLSVQIAFCCSQCQLGEAGTEGLRRLGNGYVSGGWDLGVGVGVNGVSGMFSCWSCSVRQLCMSGFSL